MTHLSDMWSVHGKYVLIMLLAFSLLPVFVVADPANPPPPPTKTSVQYTPNVSIRSCGEYKPGGQTITYCPTPLIKQKTVTQGGSIVSQTRSFVCGKNNNNYKTMDVSGEWYCPTAKVLASRHRPGEELDAGFGFSLETNGVHGVYRSDTETTAHLTAYIPACINRIPMMNLHVQFNDSDGAQGEKTGIYAKHRDLDYRTENGGILEHVRLPQQEAFRKSYTLGSVLRSYRMWSFRQRFAESLTRTVNKKDLSMPQDVNLDEIAESDLSPQNIEDLYVSADFMKGKLADSSNTNAIINYTYMSKSACSIDVRNLDLGLETVDDLRSYHANNPDEVLEKANELCNPRGESKNITDIEKEPAIYQTYSTLRTDVNVSRLGLAQQLNFTQADNTSNVTRSSLYLDWMRNNTSSAINNLNNHSHTIQNDDFTRDNAVAGILSNMTVDNTTVDLQLNVSTPQEAHDLATLTLNSEIRSTSNSSWNWRTLRMLTLTNFARCLYNWNDCLLNERDSGQGWTSLEAADAGFGPRQGSFVFQWSQQRVGSDYNKFYDGKRGKESLQRKITVYRSCKEDEEWIAKGNMHVCVDKKVHKCRYGPSGDATSFVSRLPAKEAVSAVGKGGYYCPPADGPNNGTPFLDNETPNIECEDCHRKVSGGMAFEPNITDASPSSGIDTMKVCMDENCETELCTVNEDDNCTFRFTSCESSTTPYWIKVEDRAGNSKTIEGGDFRSLKGYDCPCSSDGECATGLCKGAPPRCAGNPTPNIDLE